MTAKQKTTMGLTLALLLLPIFAAGAERKAIKKTVVPRLNTTTFGFKAFVTPAGSGSTTTQDAAEVPVISSGGAQSVGGAGISEGAGDVSAKGAAIGSGFSKGSSGSAGAAPGKPTSGRAASSAPAPSWMLPAGCRVITSGRGSTEDSIPPHQVIMNQGETFAFEFTMGSYSVPVPIGTGYASANSPEGGYGLPQRLSLSQNPCDFSQELEVAGCAIYREQDAFFSYFKDDVWYDAQNRPNRGYCKITAGKTYYFNVANMLPNGVDSCKPGFTCAYTVFHGGMRYVKPQKF